MPNEDSMHFWRKSGQQHEQVNNIVNYVNRGIILKVNGAQSQIYVVFFLSSSPPPVLVLFLLFFFVSFSFHFINANVNEC